MAVIRNRNTSQTAMTGVGLTGAQSEFFIPASRFYIKAVDATPTPVIVKSKGATPTGWTDTGIMMAAAKVSYSKNVNKIRAGIDKRLAAVYDDETNGEFEVTLTQYDDLVMASVTGLSPYVVQSGSIVRFAIGSEAIVQKAILLVSQNKIDGKEVQYYNPNAYLRFAIEEQDNAQVVKVTADLPMFTIGSEDMLFTQTFFHTAL